MADSKKKDPWDRGEEEGVRGTSFFEIPGVYEMKKKVLDKMRGSKVPGAGIAADVADILVPESMSPAQIVAKAGKLKAGAAGAAAVVGRMMNKAPQEVKVAEKLENMGENAINYATMNKIKQGPVAAKSLDYGEINAIKQKPSGMTLDYNGRMGPPSISVSDPVAAAARKAEAVKRLKDKMPIR